MIFYKSLNLYTKFLICGWRLQISSLSKNRYLKQVKYIQVSGAQQTLPKVGSYYEDACRYQRSEHNSGSIQRDKQKSKKGRQWQKKGKTVGYGLKQEPKRNSPASSLLINIY